MEDYTNGGSLFPPCARKVTPTLHEICVRQALKLIKQLCENNQYINPDDVRKFRKYVRKRLPYHIMTELLERLLPTDPWILPCNTDTRYFHCHMHWECRLMHDRLPVIIDLLFSEDITRLNINLRRVNPSQYPAVFKSLYRVLTKLPRRDFPLLNSLVIQGGGKPVQECITQIEEIVDVLRESAPNLENLVLPIASNIVLSSVSGMSNLRAFCCERSVKLNKRGLLSICARDAKSRKKLEVCHIGIFRHKNFEKNAVSPFVRFMENLKEFSFVDHQRCLGHGPWSNTVESGDKVLTYSVFKTAIRNHEKKDWRPWPGGRIGPELLATDLREMTVVDRSLKPHYILESAPKLTRLSLDWQEELGGYADEERYSPLWFKEMIRKPSWETLSQRLTRLDITFPSAYSPNAYGLPLDDYVILMKNVENLVSLRLVGAGMSGPFPLIPTLRSCPLLEELVLEKTPIHIPGAHEPTRNEFIHKNIKTFRLLDELSSLLTHSNLTSVLAVYLPGLEELELQPQLVSTYRGLSPKQIKELSVLPNLERLSLPISTQDCQSNMPEVVYVLKEFRALRHLVLSWGSGGTNLFGDHVNRSQISFSMAWLHMALGAENANINLQFSAKHHHQEFFSPSNFVL